jgi:cytochrome c oxidase assembly protein subunit 15
LHRHAVLTAVATLALIALGGMVTSKGAGMAVPDWPNSYGYNMYALPFSYWVGGALYEHTHRLLAAVVGLLTTILAVWLWMRETQGKARWAGVVAMVFVAGLLGRMGAWQYPIFVTLAALAPFAIALGLWQHARHPGTLRWLGVTAFAAVILQGVLGGLRVVWLADEIGVLHGTLAQLFLVLLAALALFTSRWWARFCDQARKWTAPAGLRQLLLVTALLALAQLIVAATMRHQHAGLAIPDFPLAYGKVWPETSAAAVERYNQTRLEVRAANPITAFQVTLQMVHRLVAYALLVLIALVAARAVRQCGRAHPLARLALAWLALVCVQVGLGAWTIWSNKAADIATLHVVCGALTLVNGAVLVLIARRAVPATAGSQASVPVEPNFSRGRPATASALD